MFRERYIRDTLIDAVGPWHWFKDEYGVWDGPSENWPIHKSLWYSTCKQFRTCIQAGGALGMYPRLLSDKFEKVISFEPDPDSFDVLKLNTEAKNNIITVNAALGAKDGTAYLDMSCEDNVGMHTIIPSNEHHNVSMLALDNLKLENVDFIQLDIEGYEYQALLGAVELIDNWKPVISCERGNEEIHGLLSRFGYKIVGVSCADTTYSV
jgi:FkbM family methyltransferase